MSGSILTSLSPNMLAVSVETVLFSLGNSGVRRYLTTDVSILVPNALISSHLDYCNSLFGSLSKLNLRKLQCIQNSAARIETNTCQFSSTTPVLKELHWLPVEHHPGLQIPPLESSTIL